MSDFVSGTLGFWPDDGGDITTNSVRDYDIRQPSGDYGLGVNLVNTHIADARNTDDLDLETAGFQLFKQPTSVTDFYDCEEVMSVYYEECKAFALEITGADIAFTFDHLIREPGRQISGGGTDGKNRVTGAEAGGGYIGTVHMDYTENTTWHDYLALQAQQQPANPSRVIALNFWRPLSVVVENNPLAICDARTVEPQDLFETVVYGYGADNYSWHDIGIETYNVKYTENQCWHYYPRMTNQEVLIIKSYDSDGVIGRTCPHASFQLPNPKGEPRRSIELRVLCFGY